MDVGFKLEHVLRHLEHTEPDIEHWQTMGDSRSTEVEGVLVNAGSFNNSADRMLGGLVLAVIRPECLCPIARVERILKMAVMCPARPKMKLTDQDLQVFTRLGIPPELLERAGIMRVTDRQAREEFGITGGGDMSGIAIPYWIPASLTNGSERRPLRIAKALGYTLRR